MASLSNQLATLTEAVKNLRSWITEKFKKFDDDHDDLIAMKTKVAELEKKFENIESLKRALIVSIVGAVASSLLGLGVAVFNMMAKGEPTP